MAERKLSAIISVGAELGASFQTVFGGAKKHVDELGSAIRASNSAQAEIKRYAGSSAGVEAARANVHSEQKRLLDLNKQTAYVNSSKELEQLDKEIDAQRSMVDKAKASLEKKTTALDKEREALQKAGVNTRDLSGEMDRLSQHTDSARKKIEAFSAVGGSVRRLGSAFRELKASGVEAALAVGAVGAAAWKTVSSFYQSGDEAQETAQSIQMSTRELLRLRYAGERVGVQNAKLDEGLNHLNQLLVEVANNSREAAEKFYRWDIDANSLEWMTPAQRVDYLADSFRALPDSTSRAGMAADLFGKKNFKMANLLGLGAQGLRDLAEEGEKAGYVLSDKKLAQVDKFDSSWGRFKATLQGIRNEIGSFMLPVVGKALDFLSSHTSLLKLALASTALVMGGTAVLATAKFGLSLYKTAVEVKGLASALGLLGKAGLLGRLGASLGGLSSFSLGGLVSGAGSAATAIGGVGSAIMAIPGIGWIIAAVVGGALLVWKYWKPIKAFLGGIWDGFSEGLGTALSGLRLAVAPIWQAIKGLFGAVFGQVDVSAEKLQMIAKVGRLVGLSLTRSLLVPLKLIGYNLRAVGLGIRYVSAFLGKLLSEFEGSTQKALGQIGKALAPVFRAFKDAWRVIQPAVQPVLEFLGRIGKDFGEAGDDLERVGKAGAFVGKLLSQTLLAPVRLVALELRVIVGTLGILKDLYSRDFLGAKDRAIKLWDDAKQIYGATPGESGIGDAFAQAYAGDKAGDATPAAKPPRLPSREAAGAKIENNYNVTIHAPQGADGREIARQVIKQLDEREKQKQRTSLFDVPAYGF